MKLEITKTFKIVLTFVPCEFSNINNIKVCNTLILSGNFMVEMDGIYVEFTLVESMCTTTVVVKVSCELSSDHLASCTRY